jgi:hypothetical protein
VGTTIRRIFYSSEPTTSADQVPAIIKASRRNNASASITGLLIYAGDRFAQLIEGPPVGIANLLESLHADTRHRDMKICIDETSDERWISNWSMGYLTNATLARHVALLCASSDRSEERITSFRKLLDDAHSL